MTQEKKHYNAPQVFMHDVQQENVIALSGDEYAFKPKCDSWCKLWHICQDRDKNQICYDKKY